MIHLRTLLLTMGFALSSTIAIADGDTKSVVRMVIHGTSAGGGGFVTSAISVSAAAGAAVVGGYVTNPATGAVGTAAVAGPTEDSISDSLVGFTKSNNPYETSVCSPGTCSSGVLN